MSNPNNNTNSMDQQLAERRARLTRTQVDHAHASNSDINPQNSVPHHSISDINEIDDYTYAMQLQQQFDAEEPNENNPSILPQDISQNDADTDDIDMFDDHSTNTNTNNQSIIDEDHEIALQLQRQFDNEESNVPQPSSDTHNNRNNNTNINTHTQGPSDMNPYSFSSNTNNSGTTIITTRMGPNGNIIRTISSNNNNNNPTNTDQNPFNHPFFQQPMRNMSTQMPQFNHPMFQSNFQGFQNNNNQNNADPFNDPFFQNNAMPPMMNMNMMINNLVMGDGMHGFRFMQPRPRVANQHNVDALPTDTYRAKTDPQRKDNGHDETDEEKDGMKHQRNNKESKESCSICLEEFKDGEEIRRLPCLHIFHKNEIDRWLTTGADRCPICRVAINGQMANR